MNILNMTRIFYPANCPAGTQGLLEISLIKIESKICCSKGTASSLLTSDKLLRTFATTNWEKQVSEVSGSGISDEKIA